MALKMQVVLFSVLLQALGLAHGQVWRDSNTGIMVKTLYLPLRKGTGSSISLQDLGSARHLTTFNIPFLPLRQTSGVHQPLNQDYNQKPRQQDALSNQLQDVGPKAIGYTKTGSTQPQATNYESLNYIPPLQQPAYSNVQQQSSVYPGGSNVESQNYQLYQPQHQQNSQAVQHSTNPSIQQTGDRGHFPVQRAPSASAEGSTSYVQSISLSEQMYPAQSYVPQKKPASNIQSFSAQSQQPSTQQTSGSGHFQVQIAPAAYTEGSTPYVHSVNLSEQTYHVPQKKSNAQLYSAQSQQPTYAQSYPAQSNPQAQYGQDAAPVPLKPAATFAGESSRFVRQMMTEPQPQPVYPSTSTNSYVQRPLPVVNQYSYSLQGTSANQQADYVYGNSQYQDPQAYDKRQMVTSPNQQVSQHQPITSTYAIVHQRIPTSNYITQEASEQAAYNHGSTSKQPSDGLSQANAVDSRPVEYVKITAVTDNVNQYPTSNLLSGENHHPEISGQLSKKAVSQGSQAYPVTAKVHLVGPQYSTLQDSLSSGQYVGQQPSSSGYQVVQSYDNKAKPSQQQSSVQSTYPDPSSETYYPEDSQVYIAPPQGYASQGQSPRQHRQTLPSSEQSPTSKYPSSSDSNVHYSQVPVSVQSEQLGIHIAIPNNYY